MMKVNQITIFSGCDYFCSDGFTHILQEQFYKNTKLRYGTKFFKVKCILITKGVQKKT